MPSIAMSETHELLRSTCARLIRSAWPMEKVRAYADGQAEVTAAFIRQAADVGWFGSLVPEEYGGGSVSGSGLLDAVVIATERGRGLQPSPFVSGNVVADCLARQGTEAQKAKVLPAIVRGEAGATWAIADELSRWDPGRAFRWGGDGERFVINGTAALVQDALSADWLLVTAGSDAGLSQFLLPVDTPGLRVEQLRSLDVTRTFCRVECGNVVVDRSALVGEAGGAAASVERQMQVAAALTASEMVGAMERDLEMTVEYAKARVAFGRPIGSFQAVKHSLADSSLLLESSKAVADAAAQSLAQGVHAAELVSVAKAYVGDSAVALVQNCSQIFAGIGFTWEHDHHLYLRRLTMDAVLYGDASWHRERIYDLYASTRTDTGD